MFGNEWSGSERFVASLRLKPYRRALVPTSVRKRAVRTDARKRLSDEMWVAYSRMNDKIVIDYSLIEKSWR